MSAPGSARSAIELDFVADLACPWCYLGLARLDRARQMRPELSVEMRWRPFFLNPHLPPEGMDRATYLRRKFGGDFARVYARIEAAGREDDIGFAFDRIRRTPNTRLAHRLVLQAETGGRAEPLIRALFRALFEDGQDVGRREVLADVAAAVGFERGEVTRFLAGDHLAAEVDAAHRRAVRIGIHGVPVFIVSREHAISGAQPPEVLAGLLDIAASAQAETASA